ncbi:hypothetical protein GWI33_019073 [Rhynchophorus ferrugineus]|uniref:Uncharacterized protein n=1 Tax=Rhynchophorus ferrugineus TaxID=354439 RepID=A0A834HYW1_RHYFE|nr:hypothetical protein GWI33_019073 [Rhynchophorus ferrugineus]
MILEAISSTHSTASRKKTRPGSVQRFRGGAYRSRCSPPSNGTVSTLYVCRSQGEPRYLKINPNIPLPPPPSGPGTLFDALSPPINHPPANPSRVRSFFRSSQPPAVYLSHARALCRPGEE